MPWPRSTLGAWGSTLAIGALSGLLFTLSIPKAEFGVLAWVFLVPPLVILPRFSTRASPWREIVALGLVTGTGAGLGRIYWLAETLDRYGELSSLPATLTNGLLILYLSAYTVAFLAICSRVSFASRLFPWTAASVWVLLEWSQTWVITGFPWELVGYSQYRDLALIQIASITGVYGVSFLVILANASVAQTLAIRSGRLFRLTAPALLVTIVYLYGYARLADLRGEQSDDPGRIAIVQGNIPQSDKWDPGNRRAASTDQYIKLCRELTETDDLDLVIFPETALPYLLTHPGNARYMEQIRDLARELDTPLLVGTLGARLGSSPPQIYNRALLLDATGDSCGSADKVHLVPFGEYLPLPWLFQYLEGLTAESGPFSPGIDHRVVRVPDSSLELGTFICYESIFAGIPRQLTRDGANLLVNTTNDAWFGTTAAPYQHFSMAVLRAVECGRTVVRAANTGISGVIAPTGEILRTIPLNATAVLTVEAATRSDHTVYVRFGDAFLVGCALYLGGLALSLWYRGHRDRPAERGVVVV